MSKNVILKTWNDGYFNSLQLNDLIIGPTLGDGGYGRVNIVQIRDDSFERSFALKAMKKAKIVELGRQEHIISEKKILSEIKCNFIVQMHTTFQDTKRVYILMECCQGGDLFSILNKQDHFCDATAKFYIACVTIAFKYLHDRNIVYRDLKPENLVLDNQGFLKLIDLGLAKKLTGNRKSYNRCGTTDYFAPEVVRRVGHDRMVDHWCLGVVTYEFLSGNCPFAASSQQKTEQKILEGITHVEFPSMISESATDFIKRLCNQTPRRRLGYKNGMKKIKMHKWFDGFDWRGLANRTLTPPILPQIRNVTDSSNFEECAPDSDCEEVTDWNPDF